MVSPRPVGRPSSFRESGGYDSLISVVAFIAADRLFGLPWAIAAATAWSLKASYTKHRRGQRVGWLLPITTAYLVARGIVGIAFGRGVYFGISIGTKYAIGLALLGSVLVGRAVLRLFVHKALPFPDDVRAHPIYISTMNRLTVVAGLYELASATADVWLYHNTPKGGFVVLRYLANSVTSFVCIFAAVIYADTRLKRIPGFAGLLELVESTMQREVRPSS